MFLIIMATYVVVALLQFRKICVTSGRMFTALSCNREQALSGYLHRGSGEG